MCGFFAVLFFLYLAYRVAVATAPGEIERERRPPPGFYRALLIQWINPKGLSYALSLTGLYVRPTAVVTDVAALMVMTAVLSFLSTLTWTLGGSVISRFLKTPRTFFWFKFVMVAFLLYAMTGILDFLNCHTLWYRPPLMETIFPCTSSSSSSGSRISMAMPVRKAMSSREVGS